MEGALFDCPAAWEPLLPAEVRPIHHETDLLGRHWDLLALTVEGCRSLGHGLPLHCRILLLPGDCCGALLARLRADTVISYGLSPRDSLTLSSLTDPMLCVQRELPRPDGGTVEPQELALRNLPGRAEILLPLLGIRLLQMPLTEPPTL